MILPRAHVFLGAGVAAAALLLQGCATKPAVYGPITAEVPYGYTDRPNKDEGYTLLIKMPGNASVAMLKDFFDRRAGELCSAGVDRTNVFRVFANEYYAAAPQVYGSAGVGSRSRVGVEMEGYVYCKPGSTPPKPATTTPATTAEAKAE